MAKNWVEWNEGKKEVVEGINYRKLFFLCEFCDNLPNKASNKLVRPTEDK